MTPVVRPARRGDADFLAEMLVEAASWRADGSAGDPADVLSRPELARYVACWLQPGDLGVVAMSEGQRVGAAWARRLAPDVPGYGFVDDDTPEVSMAVVRVWRGRGVGTRLLHALIAAARVHGVGQLSLSVEPDNAARRLYERTGFRQVGTCGGALTLLLPLVALGETAPDRGAPDTLPPWT